MKALSAQFDRNGSSMQANRQKTEMLNRAIETNRQKLAEQRHMLEESTRKYGEADSRTQKWKQTVAETEAELARLQMELQKIPNGLQMVGEKMQQIGDKMQSVGKNLTTHLTLPIVALGTAAVKVAADFEQGMSKVQAISGASAADMQKLTDKAREMGETTIFSATESAEAMQYMAMAGWKTEDMLNGLEGVMDLAAASGADLATTSDIVTDALTAFGKSAEDAGRLADIMAAASANANTNVEMMGETFQYAAPIAGTLGMSMEDVALATSLMANAGVKATNAGTALRAGLTRLAAPPKAAKEALSKYNIEVTDTEGNMLSLRDIMENVRGALGTLSESEQAAALNAIFGKNAISGWAAVLNATESDFNKLASSIDGSSGAAKNMAETMKDNLKGQLTMLKSQLESVGIEFGSVIMPYVKKFVTWLGDVVNGFKRLSPETKDLIVKMARFAAAAGPILAIGGKLVSGIGKITSGIGGMIKSLPGLISGMGTQATATGAATGAQLGLNAAMYACPIIAIIGGIAALTAGIVAFNNSVYDSTKELTGMNNLMDSSIDNTNSMVDSMKAYSEAVNKSKNELRANSVEAEHAANTLKEIGESGDLSEMSLAKMSVAVQELNSLFPDLGLEIDRSTGKLNKSQEEIDGYIKSAKKMAVIEEAANLVELSVNQMAEASQHAAVAQANLDAMMVKKETIEGQAEAFNKLQIEYDTGRISLDDYRAGVEALDDRVKWLNYTTFELGEHQYNAAEYAGMLERQTNELTSSIESQKEVVAAANQEYESVSAGAEQMQLTLDELKAAEEAATEAQKQNAESLQYVITEADQATAAWNMLDEREQAMAQHTVEAMTTIQSGVESALSSQMNMFEQFETKSAMSTDQLLSNMQSQVDGVKNWESNLKELAERGIDQDLLQKLAAMGPEGAGYVETFKNMSAAQMKEANDLWKEGLDIQGFGNDEAVELQNAVGAMAVGGEAAFTELGAKLGLSAQNTGGNIGKGLIKGLETLEAQTKAAAKEMGEETIKGVDEGAGVASPSKKTLQTGKFIDMGLANGINQGKPMILAAINQVIQSFQNNFLNKLNQMASRFRSIGQGIVQNLANGMKSAQGQVTSAINTLVLTIQNAQTKMQGQIATWRTIGTQITDGLAAGIAAGQSKVIGTIGKMIGEAVTAAKSKLDINSPSKVADKVIGRNFDAGVAQGIERNIPLIQKSIEAMASAMVVPMAPQSYAMASGSGSYNTISNDFGGTVINVYGADGQSTEELADIVIDRINDQYMRMSATWGR